ncbi:NlpC/P60 family protein [Streptomyces sp. NBC_01408]|uniref:NlpC/P60 family protein n=1 Tax=Streptomyces sp. NBC_01408 TaxID=2903855 RepID=UPI002257D475|nr:NlpC/P60 family protein [Streptomyces sp. NBC_01408]MCX4690942.1 NlpC/P60 family protein [Streptomyces sp. NBC_01408]
MRARDAAGLLLNAKGTVFKLKAAAVVSVVLVLCLLLLGLVAALGGDASAVGCGDRGRPGAGPGDDDEGGGAGAQRPGEGMRKAQIANAETIDGVAKEGGLSGRATLIALMTAMQESTLLNLDYGDRDSVGLFQQRPVAGWGTPEQIMQPKYAAKMFFWGGDDGDPPGLTDIRGWESMKYGAAAQAVQRSAYPDLYDQHEDYARGIARDAGIDLNRRGTGGSAPGDTGDPGKPDKPGGKGCEDDGAKPGEPGAPFHDGAAGWPAEVKNPRSTKDAIAAAREEARSGPKKWYQMCLAFTAYAYGWSYSGVGYAIDHYKEMPASMKHDKDRNPPPGALMYWDTGQRAGHVAVYLGDGQIASNDIRRPGYIDVVPATEIETKWGATYLGWAPPYFPKGG